MRTCFFLFGFLTFNGINQAGVGVMSSDDDSADTFPQNSSSEGASSSDDEDGIEDSSDIGAFGANGRRYDEALEVSASVDHAESSRTDSRVINKPFDIMLDLSESGASVTTPKSFQRLGSELETKECTVQNNPFDEALDLSESKVPETASTAGVSSTRQGSHTVHNKPFDEALDLSDSEASVATQQSPLENGDRNDQRMKTNPFDEELDPSESEASVATQQMPPVLEMKNETVVADSEEDSSSSSSEEEESADGGKNSPISTTKSSGIKRLKPEDVASLRVSNNVRDLFEYIERYNAQDIELDTKMKAFIPDYLPALGHIDNFVKVPRPDGQVDGLGVSRLDESAGVKTDATVLELQLRAVLKQQQRGEAAVRSIDHAHKNPGEVQKWIEAVAQVHRTKALPQVSYHKSMPDIEQLMQVWPEEVEHALDAHAKAGGGSLSEFSRAAVSLTESVKLVCAFMDIPVHPDSSSSSGGGGGGGGGGNSLVEALHVLFTLYSEFTSNQHFVNMNDAAEAAAAVAAASPSASPTHTGTAGLDMRFTGRLGDLDAIGAPPNIVDFGGS
jgi:intraflagellar transport protein 46